MSTIDIHEAARRGAGAIVEPRGRKAAHSSLAPGLQVRLKDVYSRVGGKSVPCTGEVGCESTIEAELAVYRRGKVAPARGRLGEGGS